MYSSTVEQNKTSEADMLNIFNYAATNTTVEFSLTYYNKGGKDLMSLGTFGKPYADSDFSPGSRDYNIEESDITKRYHNHPSNTVYTKTYTERYSMGDVSKKSKGGDSRNAILNKTTFPNYILFPKSTNLYNLTQEGIKFIQKINNNAKNLKK